MDIFTILNILSLRQVILFIIGIYDIVEDIKRIIVLFALPAVFCL